MKMQFIDDSWVDISSFPRELCPRDADWRENPYYKFNEKDIDPSEIDAWLEARLGKLRGFSDIVVMQRSLDPETCRRLCRYFRIFAENQAATEWFMTRDPIRRLKYLAGKGPVIKEARRMADVASKREDVDRMYDYLTANGIDPV